MLCSHDVNFSDRNSQHWALHSPKDRPLSYSSNLVSVRNSLLAKYLHGWRIGQFFVPPFVSLGYSSTASLNQFWPWSETTVILRMLYWKVDMLEFLLVFRQDPVESQNMSDYSVLFLQCCVGVCTSKYHVLARSASQDTTLRRFIHFSAGTARTMVLFRPHPSSMPTWKMWELVVEIWKIIGPTIRFSSTIFA